MNNREIKFRAWDKENEEIYEVIEIGLTGKGGGVAERDHVHLRFRNGSGFGLLARATDEVELMQYTGLKDKNGKEIYEGDILLDVVEGYYRREDVQQYGIVRQRDGAFFVDLSPCNMGYVYLNTCGSAASVVGNIYENPELIK